MSGREQLNARVRGLAFAAAISFASITATPLLAQSDTPPAQAPNNIRRRRRRAAVKHRLRNPTHRRLRRHQRLRQRLQLHRLPFRHRRIRSPRRRSTCWRSTARAATRTASSSSRERPAKNFGNVLKLDELAANPQYILPGNPFGSKLFKQIADERDAL